MTESGLCGQVISGFQIMLNILNARYLGEICDIRIFNVFLNNYRWLSFSLLLTVSYFFILTEITEGQIFFSLQFSLEI